MLPLENHWVRLDPLSTSHTDVLWEVVKDLDIYKYSPERSEHKRSISRLYSHS
jgi:hypothetical protein